MSDVVYLHNSGHKDFIRNKWIEFATEIYNNTQEEFSIITFPAKEMQDLKLFADKGLIEWEKTETESYRINKGKVICFEKSSTIFAALQSRLVNAKVEPSEIGTFLRVHYSKFMAGKSTHFPAHVINLDYDGNISKNKVAVSECVDLIFKYQRVHKRSFSFFLTWPCTVDEDEMEYKQLLNETIQSNIDSNANFREIFSKNHKSLANLTYDHLSIIGISKMIINSAANQLFTLDRNEFYIYGENDRRKMYSILFNFNFTNRVGKQQILYNENVPKSLETIKSLQATF